MRNVNSRETTDDDMAGILPAFDDTLMQLASPANASGSQELPS